jgi:rhodanese-related sulfurtransferase
MIDGDDEFGLINVLSESDFLREHIPGSVNIPVADKDFLQRVRELPTVVRDVNRKIVIYCAGPQCKASPTAAKELEKAGFTNVLEYSGGMQEWKNAGYPVESGHIHA